LGVGLAFSLLPDSTSDAVNWSKAQEIGLSLLISPLFGFSVTIVLMYLIRTSTKKTETGDLLFKEPKKNTPPQFWNRAILFITCTLVSFFHGSNDGQKGVGLVMLILIGIVPAYFALNVDFDPVKIPGSLTKIESVISSIDSTTLSAPDRKKLSETRFMNNHLQQTFSTISSINEIPKEEKFDVRKDVMVMDRNIKSLMSKEEVRLSEADKATLKAELKTVRKITDYSPTWVLLMISLSLGVGTMIGWKRIVKTVGEKIGKEHLTYAQGASAELVAASTIGLSTYFGLPVSTTHVLSSGIAGSMVANKGVKNLQPETVRNILIAWFLTLPVVMTLAGTLFLIFRSIW
jgi:PiT family inorganic phosphate transporter